MKGSTMTVDVVVTVDPGCPTRCPSVAADVVETVDRVAVRVMVTAMADRFTHQ